jgi:ribonucleotide reductase beta subunit family protein with ferritin-like domain
MEAQLTATLEFLNQLSNSEDHVKEKYLDTIQRRIDLLQEKSSESDNEIHPFYDWIQKRYGSYTVKGKTLTKEGVQKLIECIESDGKIAPWEENNFDKNNGPFSKKYSMFPIAPENESDWFFYNLQEANFWTAKELDFKLDKQQFEKISKRYQQLYKDLLEFFVVGDGLVTNQLYRYLKEADNYSQMMYIIMQIAIEIVHSETYSMFNISIISDPKEQEEIFTSVDNLPCVQAKANFINKYNNSDHCRGFRYFVGAISEGIFFVSLFTVVFYLRSKNLFPTFVHANKLISTDETIHRDYNCIKAKELKGFSFDQAIEVLNEALKIEIDHLRYILREPVDSVEADVAAGLTIENLEKFVKGLADQILVFSGFPSYYNISVELPWMAELALSRKTNFYDVKGANYKKFSLEDGLDWQERAGLKDHKEIDAVQNPNDVDF